MQLPTKAILIAMASVLAAATSFAVTYGLRDEEYVGHAQQPPAVPPADTTPLPGATPDTSQPFWHIPYVNQDRARPAFVGILNGLEIDPAFKGRTALEICPPVGLQTPISGTPLATVAEPGPLQIDLREMPEGIATTGPPDAFLCRESLVQVSWLFHVSAGTPNANPGGSDLVIDRILGLEPIGYTAPAERWAGANIAGKPAVVAGPIVTVGTKQFGPCFAAVYEAETGVLTTVSAGAANANFCVAVAKAVIS